ncbi:YD repeat-containing protein [Larkinella arboricola]|uniref:YD repeat-containing protein n=1 Tax=Larkinella arboricola TaxID=643671 RepID=A0A327XB55_LARAB|nr:hypothetical protein [Larkinella arboricola]RAK02862.1 YD repeat-containing protein [Larkinella arboricola]
MTKTLLPFLFLGILIGLSISHSSAAQSRLKKITYSDGSVRQFFYDATGKLTKEELTRDKAPVSQVQHGYGTAGKLTTYSMQYVHPETPWNVGYSEQYNYNPQGRLSSKVRYLLHKGATAGKTDKSVFFSDSLIYNTSGQIVGRQRYTYATTQGLTGKSPVTLTTHQYRYNDRGNLAEETVTTVPLQRHAAASSQTRRIVYEYDNKPNPYRLTDCPIFDEMSWSANNCIRASTYLVSAGSTAKPSVNEYRYVYSNNLPVRRVQANNSTVLEQYEYETL